MGYQRRVHGIIKPYSILSFLRGLIFLFTSLILYFLSGIRLLYNEIIIEWELLNLTSNRVLLIFIFDYMSIFFLSLVLLISGSVIMYSNSYISSEQYNGRFIGLVIRFVMSIALLITRPNIISLLLGWDGLGVTSYLLVIFYQGSKSYNAGIITALTNRLGDGSFLYHRISNKNYGGLIITVVMLSACTKSAQIPFFSMITCGNSCPHTCISTSPFLYSCHSRSIFI